MNSRPQHITYVAPLGPDCFAADAALCPAYDMSSLCGGGEPGGNASRPVDCRSRSRDRYDWRGDSRSHSRGRSSAAGPEAGAPSSAVEESSADNAIAHPEDAAYICGVTAMPPPPAPPEGPPTFEALMRAVAAGNPHWVAEAQSALSKVDREASLGLHDRSGFRQWLRAEIILWLPKDT